MDKGYKVIPIEVKYKEISKIRIERSMRSFIKKYNPQKAYIIGLEGESETHKINNTELNIIPYYELLFLIQN